MGLSKEDQKRLILDILKSHQADQVTRRNEIEQLQRLAATLHNQANGFEENQALDELANYCTQESQNPDGACATSVEDIDTLIQKMETT